MNKKLVTKTIWLIVLLPFIFAEDITTTNDEEYYTIHHDNILLPTSTNNDDDLFGGDETEDENQFETSSVNDDDLFGGESNSDDDLFGGSLSDDDLFSSSEDDLFSDIDDGIEELDTTAKSDLSKGVLFEAGSIKIGGNFRTGMNIDTVLYSPKQKDFKTNLKETTFTPDLSAYLTLDARPTDTLRMYTKFGLAYPFKANVMLNLNAQDMEKLGQIGKILDAFSGVTNGNGNGNGNAGGNNGGNGNNIPELPQTGLTEEDFNKLVGQLLEQNIPGFNKPSVNPDGTNGGTGTDNKENTGNKEDKTEPNSISDLANKINIKDSAAQPASAWTRAISESSGAWFRRKSSKTMTGRQRRRRSRSMPRSPSPT